MAGVVKVIELVGMSNESWQMAAEVALAQAGKTLSGLIGGEVVGWTCTVDAGGKITEYKATVKVAFKVEGS